MVHQVAAGVAGLAFLVVDREGLRRRRDLRGRAGQPEEIIRERRRELGDDGWRIALGIDGHEQRLDLCGQRRLGRLEAVVSLHHVLDVERANVGAIGIAEVDHPVLAVEILPPDRVAVAVDQLERAADRGAGERRLSGRSAARGNEQQDGQGEGA